MTNRIEDRQRLSEMLDKLRTYRSTEARLEVQISQLTQKQHLLGLDIKRIEGQKILEVDNIKQSNGQTLCRDREVKRAMVEDLLAQDSRFKALMHKHGLLVKNIQRKNYRLSMLKATICDLESREKLLLLPTV